MSDLKQVLSSTSAYAKGHYVLCTGDTGLVRLGEFHLGVLPCHLRPVVVVGLGFDTGAQMSCKIPYALSALIVSLVITASASASTTYYIAANGNDSNNGTSKSTPWLHAPGMPNCSGNCASSVVNAGDSVIFRGGDTWHFQNRSSSPYTGGTWNWGFSGSSQSCQLNPSAGAIIKTSCIYIGVDVTWFSGNSFARPVFTQDNPISTSRPGACPFDSTNFNAVNLGSHNYLIFDNFEMSGACWQGSSFTGWVSTAGTQVEASNLYIHGWELGAASGADDTYSGLDGNMPKGNYILCDHNVFDNSDGSLGTTSGSASGFAIRNTCKEIAYSFFNKVTNGCICNPASVHDNTFQFMYEPATAQHGNVIESNTGVAATGAISIYNNVVHDTNEGVTFWPEPVQANLYFFNNVFWNISNAGNCLLLDGQGLSGTPVTVYIANNTFDSPCTVSFFAQHSGQEFNGTGVFENNHVIGYSSSALTAFYSVRGTAALTVKDNGGQVYQSTAAANSQGYTSSNGFQPTSALGATVGAGNNASGWCSIFSRDGALCSGTGEGVTLGIGGVAIFPTTAMNQRASSWDAGAYQFGASSSNKPNPPMGLAAIVQ
jgi:hypothetical protein